MVGGEFEAGKKQSQRSSSTRPDSIIVPGCRSPSIQPEADALSRLAGLEALGTVAPEENYRDPGSAARPEPPYSGGDRSHYRRGAWFALIAGVALLAGLALLAVLTGQLLVVVTALTITTLFSWHGLLSSPVVLSYWLLANGTLLFCLLAFLIGRRPTLVISAIMPVTRRGEKGESQS